MDIKGEIDWEKVRGIFASEKESYFKRLKNKLDKYPAAEETLRILAGVGIVSLALLLPGPAMVVTKAIQAQKRAEFKRRLRRFEERKLIKITYHGADATVEITQDGLVRALKYKLDNIKIKKPRRWDKMWRVVIFDVPEWKRKARDEFRYYLQKAGFYPVNESVFVHPYPCFDEIEFLRQVTGVGGEVTYMIAKSIETSTKLLRHFDLRQD